MDETQEKSVIESDSKRDRKHHHPAEPAPHTLHQPWSLWGSFPKGEQAE